MHVDVFTDKGTESADFQNAAWSGDWVDFSGALANGRVSRSEATFDGVSFQEDLPNPDLRQVWNDIVGLLGVSAPEAVKDGGRPGGPRL